MTCSEERMKNNMDNFLARKSELAFVMVIGKANSALCSDAQISVCHFCFSFLFLTRIIFVYVVLNSHYLSSNNPTLLSLLIVQEIPF